MLAQAQPVLDQIADSYNLGPLAVAALAGMLITFGWSKALSDIGKLFPTGHGARRILYNSEPIRTFIAALSVAVVVAFMLRATSTFAIEHGAEVAESSWWWYAMGAFVGGVLSPILVERLLGMVVGWVAKKLGAEIPKEDAEPTGPRLRMPTVSVEPGDEP